MTQNKAKRDSEVQKDAGDFSKHRDNRSFPAEAANPRGKQNTVFHQ
jgi:hypothetical protein